MTTEWRLCKAERGGVTLIIGNADAWWGYYFDDKGARELARALCDATEPTAAELTADRYTEP